MDPTFLRRAINDMVETTDADDRVRLPSGGRPIRWPARIAKAVSLFVSGFVFEP